MQIDFLIDPEESIKQDIHAGLHAFNMKVFPHEDSLDVACIAANDNGEFCGGLFGEIYTNTLFVKYFWLDENKRKSGLGREVFSLAESKVQQMGITDIYLDTFSFQARDFYLKLGFEEVGRYSGYPMAGVDKIFLQKRIG